MLVYKKNDKSREETVKFDIVFLILWFTFQKKISVIFSTSKKKNLDTNGSLLWSVAWLQPTQPYVET